MTEENKNNYGQEYNDFIDTLKNAKSAKDKQGQQLAESMTAASEKILDKIQELSDKSKEGKEHTKLEFGFNAAIFISMSALFGVSAYFFPIAAIFLIPMYLRYLVLEISKIKRQ